MSKEVGTLQSRRGEGVMESLVSVIIPVYNVAPYLNEALDSVVRQTYKFLEILIIDDGSSDGSGTICDEYKKDSRVTVIHQKNRGLSNARNVGLDRMTGEFVCFLDPDDAYEPSFIEELLAVTITRQSDITVCNYTINHTIAKMSDNIKGRNRRCTALPMLKEGEYGRVEALRALVDGRINFSVWNKLYKRTLWSKFRFPDGHNYEDVDITFRIFDICTSIYVTDRSLYLHRKRPGSITHTHTEKNFDDQKLAHYQIEQYIEAHIPEIFSEAQLERIRLAQLNSMMVRFAVNEGGAGYERKLESEILEVAKKIECWQFRSKMAFHMLRFCPWLLKISYPVYHVIRLFVWRVTGK